MMLRNEIQQKTKLTRKAIEYYEEKGLIHPEKASNGYRNYRDEDLKILMDISFLRKLGISLIDIESYLHDGSSSLASILRFKQHQLELDEKRKEVLEMVIKKEDQKKINEKLKLIETEESMYERLEKLFPGYFGQMLFAAYQPFLNEPLSKDQEVAFTKYVEYLDQLPPFELTKMERVYIETISSDFDMNSLKEINADKMQAIEHFEEWLEDNKDAIVQYETMKNSEEFQNSMMNQIQKKIQLYMKENQYYETAIPLIRTFSASYNAYYQKMLEANKAYLAKKKDI